MNVNCTDLNIGGKSPTTISPGGKLDVLQKFLRSLRKNRAAIFYGRRTLH